MARGNRVHDNTTGGIYAYGTVYMGPIGKHYLGWFEFERMPDATLGLAGAAVRTALSHLQLAFRRAPGLVADGRDMGTVIFPDAGHKVFLTASAEERAQRRYKQLKEKGLSVTLAALLREIQARDVRDAERSVAPLKPAPDAVLIDSTGTPIESVVATVLALVKPA